MFGVIGLCSSNLEQQICELVCVFFFDANIVIAPECQRARVGLIDVSGKPTLSTNDASVSSHLTNICQTRRVTLILYVTSPASAVYCQS